METHVPPEGIYFQTLPAADLNSNPSPHLRDVMRHLIHELRQPLSGVESMAYYLGMVLGEDEELSGHCDRLRRLVHQANWILEDGSFAACCQPRPFEHVDFNSMLESLADTHAGHDDRPLRLELEPGAPKVQLPPGTAARLLEHVLAIWVDLTTVETMPLFSTARVGDGLRLTAEGAVREGVMDELLKLVDPPAQTGGLRRFVEALGGGWRVESGGGALRLDLWFPAQRDSLHDVEGRSLNAQVGSEA